MGKNKLLKFAENLTFKNLIQPELKQVLNSHHELSGNWNKNIFFNTNPIVLELGCGRGEYTVELGRLNKSKNFIGIDIKGARLWRGAKTALEENIQNVCFLRTRIEFIDAFFAPNEIDEIWITFPDPQLKDRRAKKRLTAPSFLNKYCKFLKSDGIVNLKTDSSELAQYTLEIIRYNKLTLLFYTSDLYKNNPHGEEWKIKTTYEKKFIGEGKNIHLISFMLDKPIAPEYNPNKTKNEC